MELKQPQDTQKPSPGSTRTKTCKTPDCGATTTETYVETGRFMRSVYHAWIQDEWPAGDFCRPCDLAIRAKAEAQRLERERMIREQQERNELRELFQSIGGERPLDEFTFDKFNPAKNFTAFQKARNFNLLNDNLFLYGPTGTGKTHLAAALAREQLAAGHGVKFYKVPALMRDFRRRLDPDEEEAFLRVLASTPVLVIDDLGVGKATEYVVEKLHEIIDARQNQYRNGLVITSNLSLNGIAETFKDRIADRLNGLCELLKLEGDSHRKRKP